jgi:LmbE family N-acetylglucosaminyl deacetylase
MPRKSKGTILAICAHNDDQLIGAGGTLAKYAAEGWRIRTLICSFGESSHPHLKGDVIAAIRAKEALEADRILGGAGIDFFGLHEGKFPRQFQERDIAGKVLQILRAERPAKIFTHAPDDYHPDHRAVSRLVLDTVRRNRIPAEVYSFDIWNVIKFGNRNLPRLTVDVTKSFPRKIKALFAHESQKLTITNLLWSIYLKAWWNGRRAGTKYAELFYRIA